jgi:hypothetical protein
MSSLEFLLGLLESKDPAAAAWEDFLGPHAQALRLWQDLGFLEREPGRNPVPGCPHCGQGGLYLLGKRCLCSRCSSEVDRRHLLLWALNREAFLGWLAAQLRLRGGLRHIDKRLWQLGTWQDRGKAWECFYQRQGLLSPRGSNRLRVYRSVLVLYGLFRPREAERGQFTYLSLLEVLRLEESLRVVDWRRLLEDRGDVHFDPATGAVKIGAVWQGDVPVGSKEYFLLLCLSRHLDRLVAYADIKHFVLEHTAGADTTDEASFCHRLKNRIKAKGWVPDIDRLLATTNKGDGYRLRAHVQGTREP